MIKTVVILRITAVFYLTMNDTYATIYLYSDK